MRDIERIMGNTTGAMGYDVAAAAIGKGLEDILEKFNTTVEQQIATAVKEDMEQYSPTKGAKEDINTVGELTSTLAELKRDIASLKNQFKTLNNKVNNAPPTTPTKKITTQTGSLTPGKMGCNLMQHGAPGKGHGTTEP